MNKAINLYKKISIETWDKLEFSHKAMFTYTEPSITEDLLFHIYKHKIEHADNSIQMFEAKNERTNGNDLEVYIEIEPNKYLFLAIQAKRLYIFEQKYKSLSHKVSKAGHYQIDLLLDYARKKRGVPLYLLYNYSPNFKHKHKKTYGCSLVHASDIKYTFYPTSTRKYWTIPTFENLHTDYAIPLFFLGLKNCFENFLGPTYWHEAKAYPKEELISSDEWVNVEELKVQTAETSSYKMEDTLESDDGTVDGQNEEFIMKKAFNPKYKIVLDYNSIQKEKD